ncbi:rust resistance kinase Lr10-like isoform X2 [Phoenix dactylifera]|uniref:non-specific serine/threonine protein kinase n=1 Tax=Phoenix dactylifera TaxID=42345 RepID=A0A8B8ZPP4_PHODC|nr:rust resistance kinase Lr10-like isoform X2 [Phoenix dactylifera]
MLSNFLLLFLLAHSLYLSAASFISWRAMEADGGHFCEDSEVYCGGPFMKDRYPFVRFDPLNGSCSPHITCSQNRLGITLFQDVEPFFSYTEHNLQVLLLYDCSSRVLDFDGVHKLPCSDSSAGQFYYTAMDPGFFESECASVSYAVMNQMSYMSMDPHINSTVEDLEGALQLGFEVTWTPQERKGCDGCMQSGGRCRNDSFLDDMVLCLCRDNFTYLHTCPVQRGHDVFEQNGTKPPEKGIILGQNGTKLPEKGIIIGGLLAAGIFLFVFLLLLYLYCYGKLNISILSGKNGSRKDSKLDAFMEKFGHLAPTSYSYSDVEKMTSSFNHKIGQGGYGGVYKGKLDNGRLVAVKVLNSSKGTGKEFLSEVISIGCTYHVNIVSLLGFCLEGSTRILIYEFMANGSLEKFIYTKKQTIPSLEWEKLLEIATGIARGLEYLHHGCNIGILHFDIKPHNILLDEDFHPNISDFGLAKLCRSADSIISMVQARGTVGYIAPEVFLKNFGGVSSKSDVYSYGMVVLEMVGGRRNVEVQPNNTSEIYFPHWIYKNLNLDGKLITFRAMNKVEEVIARRMILVGLWCIQTKPTDRPSMRKVLDMLEGRIIDLQIPPMPVLSSPSRSAKHSQTNHSHEIVSVATTY